MSGSEYQSIQSVVDIGSNRVRRLVTMGGYQYLYKYRSLADTSIKFTKDIVENNRLYWPCASDLNDIFECRPKIIWKPPPKARQIIFDGLMREPQFSHLDELDCRVAVLAEMNRISDLSAQKLKEKYEIERSNNAILSFSASYSEDLLWSHYADSHRGVCLQFTPNNQSELSVGMPVNYTDEIPVHNAFLSTGGLTYLLDFFATKKKVWEYEKEYRVIKQHKVGLRKFEDGELTGIILGAQITDAKKAEVSSWCDSLVRPPKIYQAILDHSTHKIVVPGL